MSPEEFLKEFGHLAETEGGIRQLRQGVLRLAVRGRLTDRIPGAQAEGLLAEVETLRRQLVEAKKASPLKDVAKVTAPFEIPQGWLLTSFGEATVCRDGQRIPVSKEERAKRPGGYDYYGASGVIDCIDDFLFDEPLLLIGEDGANLLNRSTPIAFIARGKYWVNNHAHVLGGPSEDYLRYIELFINAIDLVPYVTGTAQPKMNQAKMNSIPVVLPPLPEQKRIVEKVDQLMALCDELEAKQKEKRAKAVSLNQSALRAVVHAPDKSKLKSAWSRVQDHFEVLYELPENVKELRQTILQLAVMGKLVRQEEGDGDVRGLLRQVAKAQDIAIASGRHKSAKSVLEVPSDLPTPRGWTWVRLANLLTFGPRNGFSPTGVEYETKVKVLTLSATTRGVFQPEAYKYADIEVEEDSHLWLAPGDLLLQRANSLEYVGVAAIFSGPERQFIYPDLMMKLRIAPPLDLQFLHLCLGSAQAKEYFRSNASGTSGSMPKINQGVVNNLLVPIPPLQEQLRIVEAVRRLMSFCSDLEDRLARHRDQGQRLMQAVVEGLAA